MSHNVLERLAAGGRLATYACQGLTAEQAEAPSAPGAWSILQLMVHLLDADLVFSSRIKSILAEENPTLVPFDENAWIDRMPARGYPVEEVADLLAANRRYLGHILAGRPAEDFARRGTKVDTGPISVAQVLAYMISHVDHHLRFLYAKRANLKVFIDPRFAPELKA